MGDKRRKLSSQHIAQSKRLGRLPGKQPRRTLTTTGILQIARGSKQYKVDVKSMKRLSRYDAKAQDEWVWIELHGVRANDAGWLYGGKADLIAFEKQHSFIIVMRTRLASLIPELVNMNTLVRSPREAKYQVYNRPGRPDRITLIQTEKLHNIKWDEWAKA
jgi:hypothetical protein